MIFDEIGKFTLSIREHFDTLFHSTSAFVGALAFEYLGVRTYPAFTSLVAGSGVAKMASSSKGATDVDLRFISGNHNDCLTSGETVSWLSEDYNRYLGSENARMKQLRTEKFNIEDFEKVAPNVQGLKIRKSSWYEKAELALVPEVKSYGMLLLGLLFMSFIARRRFGLEKVSLCLGMSK
jgi:hypothetical protein